MALPNCVCVVGIGGVDLLRLRLQVIVQLLLLLLMVCLNLTQAMVGTLVEKLNSCLQVRVRLLSVLRKVHTVRLGQVVS